MKDKKGGMRSAKMPGQHFERSEGQLGPVCGEKYAGEFSNPQDLDKASQGLVSFAKKHKMKY